MKTAEQAVHDRLWQMASSLVSGKVYENRPMNEVGYPFADFEDFSNSFTGTKNGTLAQVSAELNFWDVEEKRGNVSEMGNKLFYQAMQLKDAFGYALSLRISDSTIRVLQDRTVAPSLWRCIVHLEFNIGG